MLGKTIVKCGQALNPLLFECLPEDMATKEAVVSEGSYLHPKFVTVLPRLYIVEYCLSVCLTS